MPPVDPSLLMPDVPLRFTESNQDQDPNPLDMGTYIYRPRYPIQHLTLPVLSEALPEPPTPERVEALGRLIQSGWVGIQTAEDALSLAAMESSAAASLLARTQGAQIVGTAVTSEATPAYVNVEFPYLLPVQTDLTVMSADPPGPDIGLTLRENLGSAVVNPRGLNRMGATLSRSIQEAEDERVFAALDQFAKEEDEKRAEEEYRRLHFKTRYEREQLV